MSMCRVFSCVVGRKCLLWPVSSLGKTLLAFTLLHSVLQDQICMLLQVSLDFPFLHSSPLKWKEQIFWVLVLEGLVDFHRSIQLQLLQWTPFSQFVRTLHLTRPSWAGLHGMAHSFLELDKAVVHVISLISFLRLWFSFCLPSDKDKRLLETSWWERLTMGENGPCSDRWGMLSKSLIQFSVGGRGRVPSLLFDLRPNHGGGKKIMASFKRSHASTAAFSVPTLQQATADPHLCQRLLDTHRQVWVSLLWGHCSFLLSKYEQS